MKKEMTNWFEYVKHALKYLRIYRRDIVIVSVMSVLAIYIGSILAYRLISSNLNTPIEVAVQKSNDQLKANYEQLQVICNDLDSIISNIKERDKAIHKHIFGTEVSQSSSTAEADIEMLRDAINKTCDTLPDKELLTMFRDKLSAIKKEANEVGNEIVDINKTMSKDRNKSRNIPSIQPVFNLDMSKNITPAGIRVNPFSKGFFMHKGVDYAISEDTRVFATGGGIVSEVISNGSQGAMIVIDHQNSYTTTYAHLSKTLARKGQRVKRGDIIAYSGNSGPSFLPHLHYEVKYRNKALNPFDFFFGELNPREMILLKDNAASNIQSYD